VQAPAPTHAIFLQRGDTHEDQHPSLSPSPPAAARRHRRVCIAASASATAQSSVQVFGTLDMNVTYSKSDGRSVKSMDQGGNIFPSRLGFRGTEDLGGGLAASFWLEWRCCPTPARSRARAFTGAPR
jgi:hypothetical protein